MVRRKKDEDIILKSNNEDSISMLAEIQTEPDELMTAFEDCVPGLSEIADFLPSYTLYALTLPMANHGTFREDFQVFADTRNNLKAMQAKQAELKKKNGISPMELFDRLGVKELATAGMMIRSRLEKVLLIHIDSKNAELIFKDKRALTAEISTYAHKSCMAQGKLA